MSRREAQPQLHLIAGPNGAGKTTFAREFLPHFVECREFVNADLLAAGLSPFAPERAALAAGRLMLERIHELAKRRVDFGFETTLAGRSHARVLRAMKSSGYGINFISSGCPRRNSRWRAWPTGCVMAGMMCPHR